MMINLLIAEVSTIFLGCLIGSIPYRKMAKESKQCKFHHHYH